MKWVLVAAIVLSSVAADALLTLGVRKHGEIRDFRPGAFGRALGALARNWRVAVSVLFMAVSFFAFVSLLSIADLSFSVPATAASYIFETIVAKHLLKEQISWKRWAGTGLVACGVLLVAL